MRLEAATPRTVRYVARNMREKDVVEFLPLLWADTKAEMVEELTEAYGEHPAVLCAYDGAYTPVAIGGLIQNRPGVAALLFYATDQFPKIAHALTRTIIKTIFPHYQSLGVRRIECVSLEGYDEAHRWIQVLGLTPESVLPQFGKGGETYRSFALLSGGISPAERVKSQAPEQRGGRVAAHAKPLDLSGARGDLHV